MFIYITFLPTKGLRGEDGIAAFANWLVAGVQ